MATIQIANATNPTVSAFSVTNVIRSDTGNPPSGVSFPITLTLATGVWTGSFVDPTTPTPAYYTGTATVTENGVASLPFTFPISSPGGAIGIYTTQALIEQTGGFDADAWSNIANSLPSPNQPRYQSAINAVESIMNGRFMDEFYDVPIPPGVAGTKQYYQFQRISEVATKLSLAELYFAPRGMRDGAVGGQLKALRQWAYDELDRILSRPVIGVARNLSAPVSLVASDYYGNPLPYVTNAVIPEYGGYPGWFWGGAAPWGGW